ncbi:serine-pyruvate aminotransferase [Oxobacter pfennigii]|uniref:Serine-pyruvate aminotransferase n=1 Tax=Oxobacter pfennigii TaxID=36849 RepID=A0A0P8WTB9_9CLOT|nr:alanine--glyoxylate aminotransferase family protein [Oxobacter pfennigii]KPU45877.1 serine-pyruvate aminotransferase [Oxobacter pfennigii]
MLSNLLMTPGPTYVNEEVRRALSRAVVNPDLDDDFYEFYYKLTKQVAKLLKTRNDALILCGEGILGLEAACASIIEPGDRVLCIDNGIFGRGFGDFVKMYGGEAIYFTGDYRKPIDTYELEEFLKKDSNFKMATIVHCETPSGLLNPVKEICPLLHKYNILTVVDAVSSIAGEDLRVDDWNIDIALGGSQKCLSAPPGLTIVSISEKAWDVMLNRKTPITGFYCNLSLWKRWYQEKWFPYTQPVSDLFALECAVDNAVNDDKKFKRHSQIGNAVREALEKGGFELYPLDGYSNTVTSFLTPEGLDEKKYREHLADNYEVMIAGAFDVLDGKVLRIGHMGENCYADKVYKALKAMDSAFRDFGITPKESLHKTFDQIMNDR